MAFKIGDEAVVFLLIDSDVRVYVVTGVGSHPLKLGATLFLKYI